MADPLERLTNLLALLLETRVPLSLERIARGLEGQYPTDMAARRGAFERDKSLLRDEGVPLEQTMLHDGSTGYWIDRSKYELGDLSLTADEREALQLAAATVRVGATWADDALLKLDSSGERADADIIASLPSLDALPTLFDAHLARANVSFRYRARDRVVDPYGLLSREGFWYVVGVEHAVGEVRAFRVDRIEGIVTMGEAASYTVPDGFDPASTVQDSRRPTGTGSASVLVDPVLAPKVEAELGAGAVLERRADGVVFAVPYGPALRSWVLGLVEHGELLGPPEARDDIIQYLRTVGA